MVAPLLHLIFRNADGSLPPTSWYIVLIAVLLLASGLWAVISPTTYVAFWTRRQKRSTNPMLALMTPVVTRVTGGLAIVGAGVFVGIIVLAVPGRLY